MDVSTLGSKFLIFHTNATLPMWSLQLHFFGKKNIQPVVMPNKSWDIDLKQFLKTFWKFRLIRILMNQLHNLVFLSCSPTKTMKFPFQNWLEKSQPVMTGKFGSGKQTKAIWNAFIGCLALSKVQCSYQKLWLPNPKQRYKCKVSHCLLVWKHSVFNL